MMSENRKIKHDDHDVGSGVIGSVGLGITAIAAVGSLGAGFWPTAIIGAAVTSVFLALDNANEIHEAIKNRRSSVVKEKER